VLAEGRRLRGTPLDLFGRTPHRRRERELIATYENLLDEIERDLTKDNFDLAVQLAEFPQSVRGFDTVKDESITKALAWVEELRADFKATGQPVA
jgi:indolepyruvate ferredoxin oxidoreductase